MWQTRIGYWNFSTVLNFRRVHPLLLFLATPGALQRSTVPDRRDTDKK